MDENLSDFLGKVLELARCHARRTYSSNPERQ